MPCICTHSAEEHLSNGRCLEMVGRGWKATQCNCFKFREAADELVMFDLQMEETLKLYRMKPVNNWVV